MRIKKKKKKSIRILSYSYLLSTTGFFNFYLVMLVKNKLEFLCLSEEEDKDLYNFIRAEQESLLPKFRRDSSEERVSIITNITISTKDRVNVLVETSNRYIELKEVYFSLFKENKIENKIIKNINNFFSLIEDKLEEILFKNEEIIENPKNVGTIEDLNNSDFLKERGDNDFKIINIFYLNTFLRQDNFYLIGFLRDKLEFIRIRKKDNYNFWVFIYSKFRELLPNLNKILKDEKIDMIVNILLSTERDINIIGAEGDDLIDFTEIDLNLSRGRKRENEMINSINNTLFSIENYLKNIKDVTMEKYKDINWKGYKRDEETIWENYKETFWEDSWWDKEKIKKKEKKWEDYWKDF